MYSGIRALSSIRAAHLAIGREERRKVDFLEAFAVASSSRSTSPMNRIIGCGSWNATCTPMLALVAPGPRVTKHTPGRPVPNAFMAPSAQAMNAAPPSWRQVTVWIEPVSLSASSTGRKLSPGTVNTRSQPCSARQSTSRRAAFVGMAKA